MGFDFFDGTAGFMFTFVPVFIMIVFVIIIATLIFGGVQGARQWKRNSESPVLTVDAAVVTKRTDVQRYHHHDYAADHMCHTTASTSYYATFEFASGDRLELKIRDTEYGMLSEHDRGKLTFQGTRYLGFERSLY